MQLGFGSFNRLPSQIRAQAKESNTSPRNSEFHRIEFPLINIPGAPREQPNHSMHRTLALRAIAGDFES